MSKILTILSICISSILLLSCTDKSNETLPLKGICEIELDSTQYTKEYSYSSNMEYLVVHCDALLPKATWTKEDILRFFKEERGWKRPGYWVWVDKEGVAWTLWKANIDCIVDFEEITNGVKGKNHKILNICYSGGVDKNGNPKDTRTDAQKTTLQSIINIVKNACPNIEVVGHNHFNNKKACPSFNASYEYR